MIEKVAGKWCSKAAEYKEIKNFLEQLDFVAFGRGTLKGKF